MYRLTEEQENDIRTSYQNGVSAQFLYKKYNITKYKVFKVLKGIDKQTTRGFNGKQKMITERENGIKTNNDKLISLVYGFCFNNEGYIGSTMDYIYRKNFHESCCNNEKYPGYNSRVYKTIRDSNINWDEIEWFVIKEYPDIRDKKELIKMEQYWINKLKPTLNSIKASKEA